MGIVKVDLLGLGMMAVLQETVALVNTPGADGRCVTRVDLAHLPQDAAVYDLLQRADTIGVFQVESRAQMATLPRLKPACFYDLVVEVALIRPGPIVGEMVHPYLNRRAGREPVVPLHPSLEPILARTLGVPLFQEQLLRMAMVAAGFTGGQAEDLRRAMGFKRSVERMQHIEAQLRAGMAARGITGATADRIVRAIGSFALYGFPESHAASFALLAYASAFLKVHYPAAFYTALLNNQPMGFYHPATLVKDAQRRGVRFAPVDVQVSDWTCRVEPDGAIRLGLMYVGGLRKETGQAMAAIDRTGRLEGRFRSIDDLTRRAGLRRDEMTALAALLQLRIRRSLTAKQHLPALFLRDFAEAEHALLVHLRRQRTHLGGRIERVAELDRRGKLQELV
jgi:error-prone DNA polymerase